MLEESMKLLKECLESDQSPILFLGAGFSFDAVNKDEKPLPMAKKLCAVLGEEVFTKSVRSALNDDEQTDLDHNIKMGRLKDVCDLADSCGIKARRNKCLIEVFSGSHGSDGSVYSYLTSYPWRYIFTLNIDDLVENTYKQEKIPCIVWTRSSEKYIEEPNSPVLIKLHGSVLASEDDFVFDSDEYNDFNAEDSWMLNKFATEYMSNHVIFIGTSMQEDDINIALKKLIKNGCENKNYKFFFIDPNPPKRQIQKEIDSNNNFYYIPWTTADFLGFLHNTVVVPHNDYSALRSSGFAVWNEEIKKLKQRPPTHSDTKLYYGSIPVAADYYYNYDIARSREMKTYKEFINAHSAGVVAIHGKSYVGKTCWAKRLLTDLADTGFVVLYCSHTKIQEITLLRNFLDKCDEKQRIAICFEDAAESYYSIARLYEDFQNSFERFYLITIANTLNHSPKKHNLENTDYTSIELTEKINTQFAEEIYNKLDEKSSLGKLHTYGNKRDVVKFIARKNDLIDVLYIAHNGQQFADVFSAWVAGKRASVYYPLFQGIVLLSALGLSQLEISYLPNLASILSIRHFDYRVFKSEFIDYITETKGYIHLRCTRLFADTALENFSLEQRIKLIGGFAGLLAKGIHEREKSRNNDIFELVIKTKNLIDVAGIPDKEIYSLSCNIQYKCKHLSYYWIQRAIACRYMKRFEDAANALEYAEKARNYLSYQICHARAKNEMEWGIWCISQNGTHASAHFQEGQKQMDRLIRDKKVYSNAFEFSAHAYIDMTLKYYTEWGQFSNHEEWNHLCELADRYVQAVSVKDNAVINVVKDLERFSKKYNLRFNKLPFERIIRTRAASFENRYTSDIDELPWVLT